MTFTKQHEALLPVEEIKGVRYVLEGRVSKLYVTALEALADVDHDNVLAFYAFNVTNGQSRDVSDALAEAYLNKFEPSPDERVPPFVENSEVYWTYCDEYEGPVDAQREWGTWNREQTGVRG